LAKIFLASEGNFLWAQIFQVVVGFAKQALAIFKSILHPSLK
jgi:hypothetical protein